jgi:ribose/xylose/arabinose/galactoside ABC-type transport system permease subunit
MNVADEIMDDTKHTEQRRRAETIADRAARRETIIDRSAICAPFVVIAALAILLVPGFLSVANLQALLVNASIVAIVGFGMTIVIVIRGLDLSVGAVAALTSCVGAAATNGLGIPGGLVCLALLGCVVGLINGVLIIILRVPAFVATLATMGIARGAALLFTNGERITLRAPGLRSLAIDKLFGIPVPFLIALVLCAAFTLLLDRTPFGRHAAAVGGNPGAAREAGLDATRIGLVVYAMSGLAAAFAGLLILAQLGTVDATPIQGLELQAIAIAVLGGTSIAGGVGNLPGTFMASLLLAMISSALNLRNIPGYYQYLALGLLLVLALGLDTARGRVRAALTNGTGR